jgi:hypothetical protein
MVAANKNAVYAEYRMRDTRNFAINFDGVQL